MRPVPPPSLSPRGRLGFSEPYGLVTALVEVDCPIATARARAMSTPPGVTLALVEAFEKATAGRPLVETLLALALAVADGSPALRPIENENERCGP